MALSRALVSSLTCDRGVTKYAHALVPADTHRAAITAALGKTDEPQAICVRRMPES
jgi:hypothetical protein